MKNGMNLIAVQLVCEQMNGTFIASLTSKAKNNTFKRELIPEESKVTLPEFTKEDFRNLMHFYSKTGWV